MFTGRLLAAGRALAGLSQIELADAAGVALTTVKGLEGGSRDTKLSNVLAIVGALRAKGVEFAGESDRYDGGVLLRRIDTQKSL